MCSLQALAPLFHSLRGKQGFCFYVIMANTIFDYFWSPKVKCKLKMELVALKELWDTLGVSAPSNRDTEKSGHLTAHLTTVFSLKDVEIKASSKSAVKWSILNSRGPSDVPEPPALNLSRRKEGNVSRWVVRPFVSEFRRRKEEGHTRVAVSFIGTVSGWELVNGLLREVWLLYLTTGDVWHATSKLYYTTL